VVLGLCTLCDGCWPSSFSRYVSGSNTHVTYIQFYINIYIGSSADSTRKLIIRGEYSVPFHISAELKQLITSMLNIEAHKRIDMDTVVCVRHI